nr:hypothetical protein [uncultured Albidiferax sp.]
MEQQRDGTTSLLFYRWRDRQGPTTTVGILFVALFYSLFVLKNGWSLPTAGAGLALAAVSALLLWRLWLLKQVEMELTPHRTLVIHRRGMWGKTTTSTYPLEAFGAIRSFLAGNTNTVNVLELVTKAGGESVLLACREPAGQSTFWGSAGESSENPEISNLRTALGERWGFTDHGFQGKRWPGAAVKGSE